jgi:hypothetical protein
METRVYNWMLTLLHNPSDEYRNPVDPRTGEVDCTGLAESAADEFDLYEGDDYDIPDWVFDAAFRASEKYSS